MGKRCALRVIAALDKLQREFESGDWEGGAGGDVEDVEGAGGDQLIARLRFMRDLGSELRLVPWYPTHSHHETVQGWSAHLFLMD